MMAKKKKQQTRSQGGGGGGINLRSVLRHDHFKNLSLWSSSGDNPIPSLAALFGRRLAAQGEASGIAPDPDLLSCLRCETILQPGINCNVRIEKVSASKKKRLRSKKSNNNYNICLPQNNVVYYCGFCSHRNLKRGTSKDHMKDIYPPKPKTNRSRPKIKKEIMTMIMPPQETPSIMLSSPLKCDEKDHVETSVANTPKPMLTLDRDRRIRRSKSKKPVVVEPESVGGSNKRKRKPLTSIKETNRSAINLKIPFLL
ncbi:unnamed protein product [Cochlearia groenlandica]